MADKKLFCVVYRVVAYALADNERDAEFVSFDALDDHGSDSVESVREVGIEDAIDGGWEMENLVYHEGHGDISLERAWPKPPRELEPWEVPQGQQQKLPGMEKTA